MGKVIKKCLACGTLNQYDAETCKNCDCALLADVDQEDEILSIDPMEAALDDAVSSAEQEDDMVAQILREQAEHAKQIVAKEMEKEARKKTQNPEQKSSPFSVSSGGGGGFSLGGSSSSGGRRESESQGTSQRSGGGFGGFKISDSTYQVKDEIEPGKVHLGGGSLRMQAIRRSQEAQNTEPDADKKKRK